MGHRRHRHHRHHQKSYDGRRHDRAGLLRWGGLAVLLLAANAELQGKIKETAAYYEQLLAAAPQCREVYGEYGLFLLRNQNPEESRKLWEEYWERESSQELEGGYTHNLFVWEERIAELEE